MNNNRHIVIGKKYYTITVKYGIGILDCPNKLYIKHSILSDTDNSWYPIEDNSNVITIYYLLNNLFILILNISLKNYNYISRDLFKK